MRHMHLATVAWLFVLGLSLAPAGAAASDNGSSRSGTDTALPGIGQVDMGEELPSYWENWMKESAFARSVDVDLPGGEGEVDEGLEKIEPGMLRSEENQAKKLTLSDVGLGALKVVGTVILVPIVVTGYVGFFLLEGAFREGQSFGFG